MKVEAQVSHPGALNRAIARFEEVTGQFAAGWVILALLNLVTQAVLFHAMVGPQDKPTGEFGVFNAALGIIGLLAVPAAALPLAHRLFFARAQSTGLDRLRESAVTLTESFAWVWGACCFVILFLPLPLPSLPRFPLHLITVMNVLLALGAVVSGVVCDKAGRRRRWMLLLISAGATRLLLAEWFTEYQPWTEVALSAYLVAGFITLAPALRPRELSLPARLLACASALDAGFLRFAAATLSVLLGLYLFTNADRIAGLSWMNVTIGTTAVSSAPLQHIFDIYQAMGLLARALLWGTQPLLWMLYAERSKLDKTTPASLRYFWIYLGTLLAGALVLGWAAHKGGPLEDLLPQVGSIGPTFAAAMVPLGLLQGLAIFSLASRRYPECFVIGGCGLVYALVLTIAGRRPELMLPYMFGAAMGALMLVLFVGVVRWGRKQP